MYVIAVMKGKQKIGELRFKPTVGTLFGTLTVSGAELARLWRQLLASADKIEIWSHVTGHLPKPDPRNWLEAKAVAESLRSLDRTITLDLTGCPDDEDIGVEPLPPGALA